MKWINFLLVILLGAVFAILGMKNTAGVDFNYALGVINLPLIVLLSGAFIVGALFTLLIFGLKAFFWRVRAKNLKHQLQAEHDHADELQIRQEFEKDQQIATAKSASVGDLKNATAHTAQPELKRLTN